MLKTWDRVTIIASFVLATASCSLAAPREKKQAQFFAGVFLLQSTTDLSAERKARLFHELGTLTGINAATAMRLLNYYRLKPAEWQHLCAAINELLTKVQALKPEASPPLPLQGR
jgi:hypothetical protein